MTRSRAGRHPEELVRHVCTASALLTVAAHPSYALPPPSAFPVPLASLLLAGAGPSEQPGGKEETGRDGSLACPVAYRQGCPRTAPVCCRGGRRSLPQALGRQLYPGQGWPGGFCGDRGGTWGTAGEAAVGKGKGERVESSQAGRRKQPGIELIVFGCSRVWLLFRCDGIRCFLGRVGRFVLGALQERRGAVPVARRPPSRSKQP